MTAQAYCGLAAAFLFLIVSTSDPRVQFVDATAGAGITFKHENGASREKLMVETFGSGVAWLDYDNDGRLDLFFANGAGLAAGKASPGNVLYRNLGNGAFVDVTRKAGVAGRGLFSTGVAVGDYDNDGYVDLYVTGFGGNQLLRNNGDGTFTDVTERAGVAGGGWSSSAGFLDYDRDGDLDLYVARYLDYDIKDNPYCGYKKEGYRMYCDPRTFDGMPDLLYRNNGDGTFTDVSLAAGIANPAGKGLGVAFGDVDLDGYPDIYVANDGVRNFLYHNMGNGTFADVAYSAGVGFDGNGKPQAGMGTEIADYDGDGLPDIFVTNFSEELNTLYRNLGKLLFEDVSERAGLGSGYLPLGFGTKLFDYDNDGDLDIVVTDCGGRPILMRNDGGNRNHWLAVRARGRESNRLGLGARVRVTSGGRVQLREIWSAGSYLSSSDTRLYFGLGRESRASRVEIVWPSGKAQILENVPADQILTVDEAAARP